MIEIFPASKIRVDSFGSHEDLLVCIRDGKGRLMLITELTRYLKDRRSGTRNESGSLISVSRHQQPEGYSLE